MNMAKIFVSYKEEDRDHREAFEGLMQNRNANFNHQPVSARRDYRPEGYDAVKDYLVGLIEDCKAVVCLIGVNTNQSEWVNYELQVASSLRIGIAPICVTDTRYVVPQMIDSKKLVIYPWDNNNIRRSLTSAFQTTAQNQ